MAPPLMSASCKSYIRSMLRGDLRTAYHHLSFLSDAEIFRGLAVPSREDIDDLFEKEPEDAPGFAPEIPGVSGTDMAPWARAALAATSLGGKVLERQSNLIYAHHVVMSGKKNFEPHAAPPDGPSGTAASQYVHHCVAMREIPLQLDEDLTDQLPDPVPAPPVLTEEDYTSTAATLGVNVNAVKAVAQVESSGSGFGDDGRPIVRYELHKFQGKTHRHFHKTHPYLSQPNRQAGDPYHNDTQEREYSQLYNAMLLTYQGDLAVAKAIESTSWGKFQVMGENWSDLGWNSALDFASDMYVSEANHLEAFVSYVQFHGLVPALKNHHWATFAAGYNGPNFAANHYDILMQQAFNHLQHAAHPAGVHP